MNGNRRLKAFSWYGGKNIHVRWLLPLLPDCHCYCEPFAGSAAVLLNRQPSPVEVLNDLDGDLCNFFRVLRDDGDELIRLLYLTPYSREEFAAACNVDPTASPLERARLFFMRAQCSFSSRAQNASVGNWKATNCFSNCGMASPVSGYCNMVAGLPRVVERLRRVQVENRPAVKVIETYDTDNTLFYVDPPYVSGTRTRPNTYRYEMDDEAYHVLAQSLTAAKAMVALSGYECELMDELFPPNCWRKIVQPPKVIPSSRGADHTSRLRQEVVWVNHALDRKRAEGMLFNEPYWSACCGIPFCCQARMRCLVGC